MPKNHLKCRGRMCLRLLLAAAPLLLLTGLMLVGVIGANVSAAVRPQATPTAKERLSYVSAIPEPSTMVLLGLGAGLLVSRRQAVAAERR